MVILESGDMQSVDRCKVTASTMGFVRLFGGAKHIANKKACPVISTVKPLCFNDGISFRRLGGADSLPSFVKVNVKNCDDYLFLEYGLMNDYKR